ncbi:hypothetical protein V6N12_050030 [Hibiscus sabdariffa]|uniref:PGG domain-containing protein n=1 Tax=Hibiscus sabdariffa TaxID=183260 RepID=A0ABR2GB80_9ROSI
METFGQRRPKISSFSSDQTLIGLLPSTPPSSFRGNRNIQKQRNFPKLASDSSSCSSDTTDEDQLMFELTSTSSKQSTGTPMKKLLAQEMSKENASRRRTPSVIARLMGLDGLPPRQPGHKQQKGIESSHEKVCKGSTFCGRQSSRKSSKDEQEFKDVFEVLDALKMENAGFSPQGTANSNLSDAEVAFVRQKFMEAKRLSTDEKLQDSEEFNDTLEVLDSNSDLLLKLFQQPDSLFTKHLHDLQGVPSQSHRGRVSAMKSSCTLNNKNGSLAHKNGRETQTKRHCKSPQGHQEDCLSHTHGRCAARNPLKSPMLQLEEGNGQAIVPTRIVVLKPNLGKLQNSSTTASSPRSSHHFPSKCTRHSEILGVQNKEADIWGKNKVHQDTGFSRHNSRDSREMGKEITRKMRNSFNNSSMTFLSSTLRGYAGDESSWDMSGSDSANDSDVTTVSYRDNIGWNKRHRRSSSRSSESSVNREAKKRLSERWKLTHKSQEMHMVSRGSTLGEMLATSDWEVISGNSSGQVGVEGCSEVGHHVGPAVWNEPLGISSRDGWKDGCLGNLSRSRSLPASYTDFGSPRISTRHESLLRDKYVIPKEGSNWDRNKAVKGNFNQKEAPLPSNQRSRVKKSQFLDSSCSSKEYSDTSQDSEITPYQVKQNKLSEHIPMVSGASAVTAMDLSSVLENADAVNDLNMPVLFEPTNIELSPPASLNTVVASTSDLDNLDSQEPSEGPSKQTPPHCPVPELESQACCKEAEQPSPVSVIEAPFTDDVSSGSECFESIGADLHELRMQLRQLKLESEACEDGTMLLSSDDDGNEVSVGFAEDNGRPKPEENWESVYIVDVLVDSGISRVEPDTFLAAWHSPECPVNPLVFQELEKKYCNVDSWSRAERRLMFDRINSKILEIYQQHRDQPWTISGRKTTPKCNIRELEDSLHKSLVSENKKPHMDEGEMVFAGEFQWLDLRSDIDKIGRGIERLLVDELVHEVVAGQLGGGFIRPAKLKMIVNWSRWSVVLKQVADYFISGARWPGPLTCACILSVNSGPPPPPPPTRLRNGYGTGRTTNLTTKCCKLARGIVMSEPEQGAARVRFLPRARPTKGFFYAYDGVFDLPLRWIIEVIGSTKRKRRNTKLHCCFGSLYQKAMGEEQNFQKKKMTKQLTGKRDDTPLHSAVRAGDLELVLEMIRGTEDGEGEGEGELRDLLCKQNQSGETALYVAAECGNAGLVKELIKYCDIVLAGIKARNGFDAFHIAAKQGDLEVLKILMEANVDLSMTSDSYNTTALHTAASQGHAEVVNFLLEKGCNVATIARSNGKTSLHSAARNGHLEIVKALLTIEPGIATRTDKKGQTALHMAVKGHNVEVVDELINSDPGLINMVDTKGNTVLHIGTRKGRIQIVQKLLNQSGAQKSVVNKSGETALDIAEKHKLSDIAGILKEHGVQCAKFIKTQPTNSARELKQTVSDIKHGVHHQLEHTRQTRKRMQGIAQRIDKIQVESLNNAINSTTVVAVLIATIAFAAIFNVPGQYADSPQNISPGVSPGQARIAPKLPFMIFIVFDAISLFISLAVVVVQTSVVVIQRKAKKQMMAIINKLMWLACVLISAAFLALSYIVVGEGERWLAIAVTGIGTVIMVSTLGTLCYWVIVNRIEASKIRSIRRSSMNSRSQSMSMSYMSDTEILNSEHKKLYTV